MGLTPKQNVIKVMYNIRILGPLTHQPVQKCTSYMESFLPSTTKLWNDLPDFIKISPTLSSFKKHLKEFFSSTPNDLYHFGSRRCNIIHCQLRNLIALVICIRTCLIIICLTHQISETVTTKLRIPIIIF